MIINLGDKNIVKDLDIFSKVGKATAYNEYIEFELKNGKIYFEVNTKLFYVSFLYSII